MTGNHYLQMLKDPRWQRKRLEIFQRDGWTCQKCFDSESPLNAHHLIYLPNRKPWEYQLYLLITLCEGCHESELFNMPSMEIGLLQVIKSLFLAEDIQELICGFNKLKMQHTHDVVASAISWSLQNPKLQKKLITEYMSSLKKKGAKKVNQDAP